MKVGAILIDELSNEELKDPTKLRLVIKDMKKKMDFLKKELKKVDGYITEDEKGLKWIVHDLIDDVETIDKKLDSLLEAQKDTRKTVKNTVLSSSITAVVSVVIGFVLKQLGIW